jgi:lipid II:glycine glycyltransferase (peptidoglycan interpeptide bridge formation enzyme)
MFTLGAERIHTGLTVELCQDPATWTAAVLAVGGNLFHTWHWGEYRQTQHWRPWRVLVREDGRPQAVLQLLEFRRAFLPLPIFYGPSGIAGALDPNTLAELASWLKAFLHSQHGICLRIDPPILQSDVGGQRILVDAGFRALPRQWLPLFSDIQRSVMVLDLSRPEAELLAHMRTSHRRYIRHASEKNLRFESGIGEQQLSAFYGLVSDTAAAKGFVPPDLGLLRQLIEKVLRPGLGTVLVARHEDTPISALMVAGFGTTAYLLYAGSDAKQRSLNANEPLEWMAIQWAKSQGCREYDMGGIGTLQIPQQGDPYHGLYYFKLGFGAEYRALAGYFDLVNNSAAYQMHRFLELKGAKIAYRMLARLRSMRAGLTRRQMGG